jgi:uncharacterized membrane protein
MMKQLRKYFLTGLIIILPTVLSVYILIALFNAFDGILGRYINKYLKEILGFYIPGVGLSLFIAIITLIGFLSKRLLGKILHRRLDALLRNFPLLRYIYAPLKQIFEFVFSEGNFAFKKVVLVPFPSQQSWTLGFMTNQGFKEAREKTGIELINVFVPTVPNPTSGFFFCVGRKDVIFLDLTINDAMKLIVSGGVLNPEDLPREQPGQPIAPSSPQ